MAIEKVNDADVEIDAGKVSYVKKLQVGFDKEDFILAFNEKDDGFEKVFAIQAENMRELVMLLFQAGVSFQKENKIDIGFGIGDEEDECTEDKNTDNE